MSIPAIDYALGVGAAAGPPGRRAVLYALAARANRSCGVAIAGDWLADACSMSTGNARRHVAALGAAGVVEVARRSGRSYLVRFAESCPQPAHRCAGCDAWEAVYPRTGARDPRTGARNPRTGARESGTNRDESGAGHVGCSGCGSRWVSSAGECGSCGEGGEVDAETWAADA